MSAARPTMQDMIKAAMAGALSRSKIASEAQRQLDGFDKEASGSGCSKCGKEKCACGGKMASAIPSDYALKLASATDYLAAVFSKQSADLAGSYSLTESKVEPGTGPGALHVMQAEHDSPISTDPGQANAASIPPKDPPMQKAHPQEHGATQMANDLNHRPGGNQTQKVAESNLARVQAMMNPGAKTAQAATSSDPLINHIRKVAAQMKTAEDAIFPAQISAGAAEPPPVSEAGQQSVPLPAGADMVASSQSVIDLKRREAKAPMKRDMSSYINEPMQSAAHDKTLGAAFEHTDAAGAKVSSANVKIAAAREMLSRMAKTAGAK